MKKTKKVMIILAAVFVFLVFAAFVICISLAKKGQEANFHTMQERLCISPCEKAIDTYMEGNGASSTDALTGNELQMSCFLSCMNEGVNSAYVYLNSGKLIVSDTHKYYDEDFNSIMTDNALVLVRSAEDAGTEVKTGDESSNNPTRKYYSVYQPDSFKEQMDDLYKKYGDDINSLVFHVYDGYVKGDQFVPANITYYVSGEGGRKSKDEDLYTNAIARESMEADGFEFVEIDDEFTIGDSSDFYHVDPKPVVIYCGNEDTRTEDRVDELIKIGKESRDYKQDGKVFYKKNTGPFTSEFFSITKITSDDGSYTCNAVTYEKVNVIMAIFSGDFMK